MILVKQVSVICAVGFALAGGVCFSARAMQGNVSSDILAEKKRERACALAQSYLSYLNCQDMNLELTHDSRVQDAFLLGLLQHHRVVKMTLNEMQQQLKEGLSVLQEHAQAMSGQPIEKTLAGVATFPATKRVSLPIACARSTRSAPVPLEDPSISLLGSNVCHESPLMQHHLGIRTLPGFVKETYYAPAVIGLPTGEPENTESDR